jgi:hypothetical protein
MMAYPEEKQRAANLVAKVFPDISCLRCGNEFFLVGLDKSGVGGEAARDGIFGNSIVVSDDGVEQRIGTDVVSLICDRCGHIERHLIDVLATLDGGRTEETLSDE